MSQHLKPTQSHPAVTSQGRTFHLRVGCAVIWAHTSGNLGCCRGGTGRGLRGAGRPRPTVFSCPWFLLRRTQCWCPGGRPPRVPAGYPLRHQVASGRSQAGERGSCSSSRWLRRSLLPSVITFSALVRACAKGVLLETALKPLEGMLHQGLRLGVITYNVAISACEKGQQRQH